jgi:hypothetical protein
MVDDNDNHDYDNEKQENDTSSSSHRWRILNLVEILIEQIIPVRKPLHHF